METKNSTKLVAGVGHWVFVGEASDIKSIDSSNKTPSPTAPSGIVHHPKFCFDDTLVAIQIENTLFNVHKYQLSKSEVFSDMFKMPKSEGNGPEEGSSLKHPIVLNGVTVSDFDALLTVLYASLFSNDRPTPVSSLIIPAFRLANMFNFPELRAHLQLLAEKSLDNVDKIVFAREFDINEWLVPAHTLLCQREEPLSSDEARKLGVESALIIMRMREQHRNRPSPFVLNQYYCYSCSGMKYYNGNGSTCSGCSAINGYLRYKGPGNIRHNGITTDIVAIEAGVTKWMEDGFTIRA
ncbi:hypothetical protein B0J17DRAFT_614697 [Rhizoctonia solani]|nr:hypothetical protein B0J17DRAFT_614697 [Rhizoctonia solani]